MAVQVKSPEALMHQCCNYPWEVAVEPFRITPHVYYVSGNNWVGCYLMDSGDGLILLDTAMANTAYLLMESIRKLGYDPHDIRAILISHAHYDHCGAARLVQEYTGAKLWMSSIDLPYIHEKLRLLCSAGYPFSPFHVDEDYVEDSPICIGRFAIRTVATPGHTPGCTSFFFEDTDDKTQKTYRCAMHGGVGLNTLTDDFLTNSGEPVDLRKDYRRSMQKIRGEPVDITIGSHPNQTNMFWRNQAFAARPYPQEDPALWAQLVDERLGMLDELERNSTLSNE